MLIEPSVADMLSSDLYYYSALIFWILGFLYMGGFFPCLAAMYYHMSYNFTPTPPKPVKPVDHVKIAELVGVWSPSKKLPGDWVADRKEREKPLLEMVDVEDGYVLVESRTNEME